MEDFDSTDMELLRLLTEDARRPYSEMADVVDLSAPAVRDRIQRLDEAGVIRRFTVDVDRSLLEGGIPVLVQIDVEPSHVDDVHQDVLDCNFIEHVYVTASGRLLVHLRLPEESIRDRLGKHLDMAYIRSIDVALLEQVKWTPRLEGTSVALKCSECGNSVTSEGESILLDGTRYRFCCVSCKEQFIDRYEDLQRAA